MAGRQKGKRRESPRTQRVREIVLQEGVELLASEGGSAVTALRISERTGVARSTIYRHWPDPATLLLDVVARIVKPSHVTRLTGDLEHDLTTALLGLRTRMQKRPFRVVFGALLENANRDPAFVEPQQLFVRGVLIPLGEVLRNAQERGLLSSALDVDAASVKLAGPVLTLHVMLRAKIGDALIREVVEQFLASLQD